MMINLIRMMENAVEFRVWLDRMLSDAKKQLDMSDESIAYILLAEGNNYFLRVISKRELGKGER